MTRWHPSAWWSSFITRFHGWHPSALLGLLAVAGYLSFIWYLLWKSGVVG